jgi:hypothetical protein
VANFSQTITNSLGINGASVPSVWDTMLWTSGLWNTTEDLATRVTKGVTNSIALSDATGKATTKGVTNAISVTTTDLDVTKSLGQWDYVAPTPTTNAADEVQDTFTRVSGGSSTQTAVSGPSTSWTEA